MYDFLFRKLIFAILSLKCMLGRWLKASRRQDSNGRSLPTPGDESLVIVCSVYTYITNLFFAFLLGGT